MRARTAVVVITTLHITRQTCAASLHNGRGAFFPFDSGGTAKRTIKRFSLVKRFGVKLRLKKTPHRLC